MEQTDPIREVVQQIQLDLSFLSDRGVLSKRWVEDSRGYLRKKYNDYLKEQRRRGPLQADQPPPRPSTPLLLDIDAEITDNSHRRHVAYQSSAPTTSMTNKALHTDPTHNYHMNIYDLDQHEWEAAGEWGGTPSPTSSDDVGQGIAAVTSQSSPSAPVGGLAMKGKASKHSNRHRRSNGSQSHHNQQRRESRETKQQQQCPPVKAATIAHNGTEQTYVPAGATTTDPIIETHWMLPSDSSTKKQAAVTSPSTPEAAFTTPSPSAPAAAAQDTICPSWLTFGTCRRTNCRFHHALLGGLPRERLECSFWRTASGCVKDGCRFEHHATAHGLQGPVRGRAK
ncbi:hypothetical protein CONLIGDRAFT_631049 [Coniochaeta ligniaria NRRL 30616]|uniref:C3H1-type domain-containing protein n=1 Tax=Coniochaeta ligniaria NRRL 30616 TaxID=1408157 RepID=A0A1J7JTS9_9PEZI|nr:hypothetical protein CONLIGDRAFT_631049 [Coniochaeta ligniaria NRRL 30616]